MRGRSTEGALHGVGGDMRAHGSGLRACECYGRPVVEEVRGSTEGEGTVRGLFPEGFVGPTPGLEPRLHAQSAREPHQGRVFLMSLSFFFKEGLFINPIGAIILGGSYAGEEDRGGAGWCGRNMRAHGCGLRTCKAHGLAVVEEVRGTR